MAYVDTVAMTGQRFEPIQFGRVGAPINPSIFDYYALSKVFCEMTLFDCGLKHWVAIRQTGQHPSAKEAGELPIVTHQPPNNVLEWSTSIESGICMANLCEEWVPESFWRKAYNLSSGKDYRLTTWELNNEEDWIKAFFGSREQQAAIPSFEDGYDLHHPSEVPTYLNHGYDESKGFRNV